MKEFCLKNKSKNICLVLCIAVFFTLHMGAQIKFPPVTNFTVEDYGGGNQNWDITSQDNYVFVANNEGLLEFDGVHWRLYTLPNKTIVRSVKVVGDKIYTGSYEEFGFWKRSFTGVLEYTSLSTTLENSQMDSQSIWEIHALGNRILFKSFGSLFIVEGEQVKVVKPDFLLMASNVIGDTFVLQGKEKGLFELQGDELILLKNTEEIGNYRVQALIAYDNALLIGTSLHGCFTYANEKLKVWDNGFNALLQRDQLNTLNYHEGKIYAGTIKNGMYEYDVKAKTSLSLNVKNGLQNNTILASAIDTSKILWLALDNGIAAIPIHFYAYYLNPHKEDIGAVYGMLEFDKIVYLATNTGIYKVDHEKVTFIEGSQGHTWSLTRVEDEIIAGHNSGTYQIVNDKIVEISPKNGGYVFKPIPEISGQYMQGNYSGLTLYKKKENTWEHMDIQGLNFPVKNFVFEKPQVAWVTHAYKGVFRITFSKNYEGVIEIEDRFNSFFKNVYDIKLFTIEKNIAFFSSDNWYVYNAVEDKIKDFESLNTILGNDKNSILLNDFSIKPLIFKNKENTLFIRNDAQDKRTQIYLPKKYYQNKLVRGEGEQHAVVVNDSTIFIALYNDVLVVNPRKIMQKSVALKPEVSRIIVNHTPQNLQEEVVLNQKDTLQIEFRMPFLSNSEMEYSLDEDRWKSVENKIVLTGLAYGDQNLKLRSVLNFEKFSPITTIPIQVNTPWYLSIWGLVLALALALLLIYFISIINKYVLIKHVRYLDEKFEHKQEMNKKEIALKNEMKINELSQKQHEIELNAKTKELANTAMEMTKKDELLENIKKELHQFKQEIINKPKFEKLLKTIDKNINTSSDWEVFQTNFNEIHDSFYNELVKKHEDLTAKDLKLCAYLKMNLSTKEIAPIMRISIRGVEIHRYRLRKKLNLSGEQNLNEYLIHFS